MVTSHHGCSSQNNNKGDLENRSVNVSDRALILAPFFCKENAYFIMNKFYQISWFIHIQIMK